MADVPEVALSIMAVDGLLLSTQIARDLQDGYVDHIHRTHRECRSHEGSQTVTLSSRGKEETSENDDGKVYAVDSRHTTRVAAHTDPYEIKLNDAVSVGCKAVSYTHLTLPTKRIV